MFPRNFVAPDGRVFGFDSNGRMYYVDTSGSGSATLGSQFTGPTGSDSSAAMFRPGRILQFGGNANTARVIDITSGTPVVTNTGSLSSQRRLVTATVLADGRVLATGGSTVWNEMTGVNYNAEIWNPTTGQWLLGPPQAKARLYHSTAVLMPDASVLVAGGGAPGPQNNTNMEIYYPPYLYNAAGGFATRPVIETAPGTIDIGETFGIDIAGTGAISRVAMIKTASVSHSWNTEQRFIELTFQQNGGQLNIQAPTKAGDAPPGYYLLFVLNAAGTPSIAKIAKVGVAANPNPAITPNLVNPGNQSGQAGTPIIVQLSATDPNGDTLIFSASGLPSGVSINPSTGEIGGTPTVSGTFNVIVTASDGVNSDSESFTWTIAAGPPFVLNTPPPPAAGGRRLDRHVRGERHGWRRRPVPVGFRRRHAAHAVLFVGDDHAPVRAAGHLLRHGHVRGTRAERSSRRPSCRRFTCRSRRIGRRFPATSSSRIAPAGVDRFWVVNQDQKSVSVFNANTNARLAIVTVGTAPTLRCRRPERRDLGHQQGVGVDQRDQPGHPRGEPDDRPAVRLAAVRHHCGTRRAMRCSSRWKAPAASSRSTSLPANTLASINVGPNVRHLSMSGDGSRLYVSRFVTPPLPGESTAVVQTQSGGQHVGGEIVVVDGASLDGARRQSSCGTATSRISRTRAAASQTTWAPWRSHRTARSAWVPSKQDNIKRGIRRDGSALNFQNTVRAISSRVDLDAGSEDYPRRIDHDNAGVASAIAFDRLGVYMFVALETSRQVAIIDAHAGFQIGRINVGRAPQGLALSASGDRLYVNNFMERTVGVFDLTQLQTEGIAGLPLITNAATLASEKLSATVLQGKRLFYDAARHAARSRRLPQLRLLPQRWRSGRPRVGPDRLRRGTAQHGEPERPRRRARASCTGATISTKSRTSRVRSAISPAATAS